MMGGPFWEKGAAWTDQSPIAHAKDFKTQNSRVFYREVHAWLARWLR